MKTPFEGKRILLGVSGSIAAYKAADLASKLTVRRARWSTFCSRTPPR